MGISVVIPVYNSESCADGLVYKLTTVMQPLNKPFEIILVNDGSKDRSWDKIVELSAVNNTVKGVNFSKNFGQDNALMAGLIHSSGKSVIIMDDDCQHDPCDIPSLLLQIEKGYDVCYANFASKKQSFIKNFGSWFNGKVANIVIGKPDAIYLSSYKAVSRLVVDEITKYDGPFPYIDGLIFGITRNITQIPATHYERLAGESNYSFIKLISVWFIQATSFSIIPLRMATFLGFIFAAVSFISIVLLFMRHFYSGTNPSGWVAMTVVMLFLGGIQLVMIGVIGEYVGRLALYNNKKPQFVIKTMVGLD